MTHSHLSSPKVIAWDDCEMDFYTSNRCTVLKHRGDVLFLISPEQLRLSKTESADTAMTLAEPIFAMLLDVHNRAVEAGHIEGLKAAQQTMRRALGLRE